VSGSEEQGALVRLARQSASWRVSVRVLILALALLVAYPIFAVLASSQRGVSAWTAAALAASICWFGATLAMLFTAWLRGPQGALYALLFGMFFRMGLPLIAGLMLSRKFVALEAAGFFGLILGFYLVALVVETLLVIPLVHNQQAAAKA
jgi:hypothetical protein